MAWLAVAMLIAVGLPGSALADLEEGKDDSRHQYVNLGVFGDHFIQCRSAVGVPGVNGENVCLGGAIGYYDPSDGVSSWDVWIHDYVWNGCDAHTQPAQDGLCPVQPGVDWGVEGTAEFFMEVMTGQDWVVALTSAGLARTVTTYERPSLVGNDAQDCSPIPPNTDPTNGPNVCLQTAGPQSAMRNTNTFGFCGQGSIDAGSGMVDPFDISAGPDGGQATNVYVEKQVFTDGPLFYGLDCPMLGGISATLKPFYDIVADLSNSLTCPVPVVNDYTACLFDLSSVSSACYTDQVLNGPNVLANTINLGVAALAGEVGWTHELTDTCKDAPVQEDWIPKGPGSRTVLKGISPEMCVSAVYVDGSVGALPTVQCPPAQCATGWGWSGYLVDCVVEDGCDGSNVATMAALVRSAPTESVASDVLCNGVSVFSANDGGANDNAYARNDGQVGPIVDSSGSVPMPGSGVYECRMDYARDFSSDLPYLAVAACQFTEPPVRPESGSGSGGGGDGFSGYSSGRLLHCPLFRSQSLGDRACPYMEEVAVALDGVAQADADANGMGDAWTADWETLIGHVLTAIVDSDFDGLLNVDEFRWDLVPKCVGVFTNCQDYDGDAWTDGSEVEYWNDENNDGLSAPELAFLDPDRNIDSNNNAVGNAYDWDSDSDDLQDGDEVQVYGTYPEFADSDCDATAVACTSSTASGNYWDPDRVGNPGKGDQMNDGAEAWAWDALGAGLRSSDHDGDGIANALLDPDSDGDTLIDSEEFLVWHTLPHRQDSDLDGLRDDAEVRVHGTQPMNWDSDGDGMPDSWEVDGNLNPLIHDAALDPDADGLPNIGEYTYARPGNWNEAAQGPWMGGTNPNDADTEGDALLDGAEVLTHETNPFDWDTDNDGMADWFETTHGLDPLSPGDANADEDADSFDLGDDGSIEQAWPNLDEYRYGRTAWDEVNMGPWQFGTNPVNPDTDGDVATDGMEVHYGTEPRVPANVDSDDDGDGLTWSQEASLGTNPTDADSDGDGLCDGSRGANCRFPGLGSTGNMPGEQDYGSIAWDVDSDSDNIEDDDEAEFWDPGASGSAQDADGDLLNGVIDSDSDNDGLTDGDELVRTTDRRLADTDGDRLRDGDEVRSYATNPKLADHDNDGLWDGDEIEVHRTRAKFPDTDFDALSDGAEVNLHGTDPLRGDSDKDGLPDAWEVAMGTQARVADADQDPDADGLSNLKERHLGSRPMNADSDLPFGDGLPDGYEDQYGLGVLTYNPGNDPDFDGLTNINEYNAKTHPRVADTDGDWRNDAWEVLTGGTDPLDPDSDKDGFDDGPEHNAWIAKAYPWNTDSDGDTLKGLRDPDSDNDGLDDRDELVESRTMPHDSDSDNDGLSDFDEVVTYMGWFSPNKADSDGDGQNDQLEAQQMADPEGDFDQDGIKKTDEENVYGTDPLNADSDCDGANDGAELGRWGSDWDSGGNRLLNADVDGDTVKDGIEMGTVGTPSQALYKTRPDVADTDGDGLNDGDEARNNVKVSCGGPHSSQSMPTAPGAALVPVQGFQVGYDGNGWYVQGGYGVRLYVNDRLPATANPLEVVQALVQSRTTGGGPAVGTNGKLTNPLLIDTDGDGLTDGEELQGSRNPYTAQKWNQALPAGNTNPNDCDTDRDGLGDGLELGVTASERGSRNLPMPECNQRDLHSASETNPNSLDSDGDGLADGKTFTDANGNPQLMGEDPNLNGLPEPDNLNEGDPTQVDSDADGLTDDAEARALGILRCVLKPDCDDDLLPDGSEVSWDVNFDNDADVNFVDRDSDGDGVPDGAEGLFQSATGYSLDTDGDGLKSMVDPDSDNDGFKDGIEDKSDDQSDHGVLGGLDLNPLDSDTDGDGVIDGLDIQPLDAGDLLSLDLGGLRILDPVDGCCIHYRQAEVYIQKLRITADPQGDTELIDLTNAGGTPFVRGSPVSTSNDGTLGDLLGVQTLPIPQDISRYSQIDAANGDVKLYLWISLFDADAGEPTDDQLDISRETTGYWNDNGNTYVKEISLRSDFHSNWGVLDGINGELDGSTGTWGNDQDDAQLSAVLLEKVPMALITQLVKQSTKVNPA